MPNIIRAANACIQNETQRRLTITAIALERQRLRNGKCSSSWPLELLERNRRQVFVPPLALPPRARGAALGDVGEVILEKRGAELARWLARERIFSQEREHFGS